MGLLNGKMEKNMNISINLTIHNKDFLIKDVLESIKRHTTGNYEIIIVLDGCTDNSEKIVKNFFQTNYNISHKILYANNVFETISNNIAAKNSSGDLICIIQDDMIINEMDWNSRLAKPIQSFSDIYAVSARTAYNYIYNTNSFHVNLPKNKDLEISDCWSDIVIAVDKAEKNNGMPRDIFAIRNSINRGPLLIKNDIFESVGFLNEKFAPLDQDDADLNYRVFKKHGLRCGSYWIDYISDLSWGGTRPDGINPASWHLKAHHKNTRYLFEDHFDILTKYRYVENRKLT